MPLFFVKILPSSESDHFSTEITISGAAADKIQKLFCIEISQKHTLIYSEKISNLKIFYWFLKNICLQRGRGQDGCVHLAVYRAGADAVRGRGGCLPDGE